MGAALESCSSYWDMSIEPGLPRLVLRVVHAPIDESLGAKLSGFQAGDEVQVRRIDKVKGFDPLRWRFEQHAKDRARLQHRGVHSKLPWPETYRCMAPRRYWLAPVVSGNPNQGWTEQMCLLQVAMSPNERSIENIVADIKDSEDAVSYASRFNTQLMVQASGDPNVSAAAAAVAEEGCIPTVKVAAPVGCDVITSGLPGLFSPGDACTIMPYSAPDVKKFLFDGGEDFLEIPQAFFHYAAFVSGGREFVVDLQGSMDDEGDVILVDPLVLRAELPSVSKLLTTAVSHSNFAQHLPRQMQEKAARATGPSTERFELLHPRCSQMCKAFDPMRRGAQMRHVCGMGVACGI
eukprot:gnl/TRDRNA2_/TRDRNA2_47880_c0_seq1.p1 gnl/TRDRNA2_/TRDRNA2_47880_c0~~gnl/TRDRNA2_/TRDRNA2_47880_c0_seq1.p1  ORF type:complete len:349 (+),score=61.03 gnl/TRDRNA2_/TRDRNA2_47880_c0_seq1:77-1123(+)